MSIENKITASELKHIAYAGKLLSSYLTYGAMRTVNQFDDSFRKIESALPYHLKKVPKMAWRTLVLPKTMADPLLAGERLVLEERAFSSWSKSRYAAERYMRGRLIRAKEGEVGVLIQKMTDLEKVVVDVPQLYVFLGWNCSDVEDWARYAAWQDEVIFHNSPSLLVVDREDVCHHQPACLIHCIKSQEKAGVMRPYVGEWVYNPADDNYFRVLYVLESQPYLSKGGIWLIEGNDEKRYSVELIDSNWQVTKHLPKRKRNSHARI